MTAASLMNPTRTVPAYVKMHTPSVWRPEPGTQPRMPLTGTPARVRLERGPATLVVTPMVLFAKKSTKMRATVALRWPMALMMAKVMTARASA